MSKIKVEVCVCTGCVMNGAIDIIESIESLQDLRQQLEQDSEEIFPSEIELVTNKCLGECSHPERFPYVVIDGKPYPKATSESIMSEIVSLFRQGCKE